MVRNSMKYSWVTALVILISLGAAAAEVYVTSPSTGRILVLDSTGALVRTIGWAGGLQEPYAITLDSQRSLLVTDYAAGRILKFAEDGSNATIVAANIPKPDGLSIGANGDLFLVSRENSTGRTLLRSGGDHTPSNLRQVWMVPAGSNFPVKIGSVGESSRLAQTVVVPSGRYKGELFVLSTRPGLIARYQQAGPTTFTRVADFVSFIPGEPTAMAFTRTGQLLVSSSDGRIMRYSGDGARIQGDFATGLPTGATRVSINKDGVVHLTVLGKSNVIRFDPYAMRLPDLNGATSPVASAVTSGCVPTPAGAAVNVSPAAGVNVIFDRVVDGGTTCLQTTSLGAGIRTSPRNNIIPGYAKKLYEDPGFVVYDITTTASFTDSIAVDLFSHNPDARAMHAHGSGNTFVDSTTLVTPTDPRARTGGLSEFVVYLDTRENTDVIALKLHNLDDYLSNRVCQIADIQLGELRARLSDIFNLIESTESRPDADRTGASTALVEFKNYVKANSGDGISNIPGTDGLCNDAGNLLGLADTLLFQLSL